MDTLHQAFAFLAHMLQDWAKSVAHRVRRVALVLGTATPSRGFAVQGRIAQRRIPFSAKLVLSAHTPQLVGLPMYRSANHVQRAGSAVVGAFQSFQRWANAPKGMCVAMQRTEVHKMSLLAQEARTAVLDQLLSINI